MNDTTENPATPRRKAGRPPVGGSDNLIVGKDGRRRSPNDSWYPLPGQVDRLKFHASRLGTGATKALLVRRAVGELLDRLDAEAGIDTTDPENPQPITGKKKA